MVDPQTHTRENQEGTVPAVGAGTVLSVSEGPPGVDLAVLGTLAVDRVAEHVRKVFRRNRDARSEVEARMLEARRMRRGEYDAATLAQIEKFGGSKVFLKVPEQVCNAAEAWILEVLESSSGLPLTLEPTPLPELPEHVKQQVAGRVMRMLADAAGSGLVMAPADAYELARRARGQAERELREDARVRAERMERKVVDALTECDWLGQVVQCAEDLVTVGTCLLRGPVVVRRSKLKWDDGQVREADELTLEFERTDPLDYFPDPDACEIDDGDAVLLRRISLASLAALKDVPGYDGEAIDEILREHEGELLPRRLVSEGVEGMETDTRLLEDRAFETGCEVLQGLEFQGRMRGSILSEWGMDGCEPDRWYDVDALVIGQRCVRLTRLALPDGRRAMGKAVYRPVVGSFWGVGVPDLMKDCVDVLNAAARSMVNNASFASGPQYVFYDTARMVEGETASNPGPWRSWEFQAGEGTNGGGRPMDIVDVPNHMGDYQALVDKYTSEAHDRAGVPPYSYGSDATAGAGRTATGLSMLMSSAARGIKRAIMALGRGVIERSGELAYEHYMIFGDDESAKGDVNVTARGALGIFLREQKTLRVQEFTQMVTRDPLLAQIMGERRLAALVRHGGELLDVPAELLPDEDELESGGAVGPVAEGAAPGAGAGAAVPAGTAVALPAGEGGAA